MANNYVVIELTPEQKAFAAKASEIIAKLESNGSWEKIKKQPEYRWLEALLNEYGTKELGVIAWRELHLRTAMNRYGGYRRSQSLDKLEIEVVYALFMSDTLHQQAICPNMFDSKHLSKYEEVRAQLKKDTIRMKMNVSEEGYVAPQKSTKTELENKNIKFAHEVNPETQKELASVKTETNYNFNAIVSSLKEQGFHVDIVDNNIHITVDTDDENIDATIVRKDLEAKYPELANKYVNLSITVNKVNRAPEVVPDTEPETPVKSLKETLENITGNTVTTEETSNIVDINDQYYKDGIIINGVKCRIWLSKNQNIIGMILSADEMKKYLSFRWGISPKTGRYYDSPAVFGAAGQLTYRGKRAFDTKTKEWTTLYSKEELRNLEVVKSVKEKLVAMLNSVD